MKHKWVFKDGLAVIDCTSFPYAFRMMHNAIKTGVEKGRKYNDMAKSMLIVSPMKDIHGAARVYNYTEASKMAVSQGLLNSDGQLNGKEFKKMK